eukprot:8785-Prorocentrum_minimum.AAC.1
MEGNDVPFTFSQSILDAQLQRALRGEGGCLVWGLPPTATCCAASHPGPHGRRHSPEVVPVASRTRVETCGRNPCWAAFSGSHMRRYNNVADPGCCTATCVFPKQLR